ncbi:transcriptional regulator [Streptomyces sp. MMG1533]|uniref:response regulator transcription factor n=1 Tax=Streptomyces sp. MMG1533 TaxID=1415546 RepID=UPI0006AF428A|nr:response regulator transcription factor [Streptomyces sp. MMG1533]KOU57035.1 transcriptional regulator [Streptomyces sp. MMG1533]
MHDAPEQHTHTHDVLLVEDDEVIRAATTLGLTDHGYRVAAAADGLEGLRLFRERTPDIALLDVMLPGLDGVSLAGRIRAESGVPVLLMSARSDPVDVVLGLEAGADDYVTKPFDLGVLVARVRAMLRRATPLPEREATRVPVTVPAPPAAGPALCFGDVTFDAASLEVLRNGVPLSLTTIELKLLREFAAAPGTVLTRDLLLERVWDYAWSGDTRVVDVSVQRLRAKVGRERIETVRGFGYKLRP